MTRNALTEHYLTEVARRGVGADELPAATLRHLDLDATSYRGKTLPRPAFLDRAEVARLDADLRNLQDALYALPDRLFGGDIGAFARAAGMTEPQVTAVLRGRGPAPTRMGRADIYHDGEHFRLMELNLGSALGGLDNAMVNPTFLTHPFFAEFVRENGLAYMDTLAELVRTLLVESDIPDGQRPLVAAVDWPASFANLEERLKQSAAAMAPFGVDVVPCHLGMLKIHSGRVWLDGRPVDVIYRLFLIEDLLDPEGPGLVDPVLRAVERGEVRIFAPMDAELYGNKAALAMVSDGANRHHFTPEQVASLDRLLPWTQIVREGDVVVDGELVDLRGYAEAERENLILKPTLLHGGIGVVPGWETPADEWRTHLDGANTGHHVLQRRIRGVPELFPTADGHEQRLLNWGVFTAARGYAGAFVRGTTDLEDGIVNVAAGATLGCTFHEAG
ncbi:hypothetical protein AB0M43_07835 [Longispora sp. NPDC051575]|uniref:hypothetical protein n=1 Tax=Longispora sp. NPDC051575 TaxID=3154943 RepID=UPI00342F7660